MTSLQIPPQLHRAAQREAQALLDETAGVTAVVVSTTDGFDIAAATTRSVDAGRIAALASSISSIGEVVSSEANLGKALSVTVETSDGFALAQGIAHGELPMVMMVMAGQGAILAQAKYRAAAAARTLVSA